MRGSFENVSASDIDRLNDIKRHFVDKIGQDNVDLRNNGPGIECGNRCDLFIVVIPVTSLGRVYLGKVVSDKPLEVLDIAWYPSQNTVRVYVDFNLVHDMVLVDMPPDGTLLFCDHTGGLRKTFTCPKRCYVMCATGLKRLQNGHFAGKEILVDSTVAYMTPGIDDWRFTYSAFLGFMHISSINLARPPDARLTDAQYREVLRQWCMRIKRMDTLRVLAHLMDTQQFEAADVMVQVHFL